MGRELGKLWFVRGHECEFICVYLGSMVSCISGIEFKGDRSSMVFEMMRSRGSFGGLCEKSSASLGDGDVLLLFRLL